MKKTVTSVLLCIALTLVPTFNSFATESGTAYDTTPTPTVTAPPTPEATETPSPVPTKNRVLKEVKLDPTVEPKEEKETSPTPIVTKTETPTPATTGTPVPTSDPTETPTPTEEPTETPTPSPTPVEEPQEDEDPSVVKSILKGLLRGPLRGPATDTTWQDDWNYSTSGGDTIILESYKSGSPSVVEVPDKAIIGGDTYDKIKFPANCAFMFRNRTDLVTVDFHNVDTSSVTNMEEMFYGCRNITSINVSGWNTANVNSMRSMFDNCQRVTSIAVTGFNTSNVTDMKRMFASCNAVTSINASGWDTRKVTDMEEMFRGCRAATSISVSGWDTSIVTTMKDMFCNCYVLESIDLSSFDMTNVTSVQLFGEDFKLETIKTPKNATKDVLLPSATPSPYWGTYMKSGVTPIEKYTKLPKNESTSITLVRYYYPESISVDPTSNSIAVGEDFTITATVLPTTTTEPTVTWTSDTPGVATVDTNGKVKGISAGTATIQVS